MSTTVTYLFDPLCGWCYGASPVIQKLAKQSDLTLALTPTGLFAGFNSRELNAEFAQFAWTNDLRIAQMTGQRFTQQYRTQVLGKTNSRLDSAAATLALTAVSITEPTRALEVLTRLQEARYIEGLDITAAPVVAQLLKDEGLSQAAIDFTKGSAELHFANTSRLEHAQRLLQSLGANGVPAIVVTQDGQRRLLRGDALFGNFDSLLENIHNGNDNDT
jgi:putative protein-disulfide isomerase